MDDAGRKTGLNPFAHGSGRSLSHALLLSGGLALLLAASPAEARRSRTSRKTVHHSHPAATPARASQGDEDDDGDEADNPVQIPLIAKGAILIDGFTGKTIYEKNADKRFYPASSTKILTALLVIEAGHLDQVVTIERQDTQVEPSAIGFRAGDRFTRRELLYALLLKSANDVAMALARDNAGSVAAFAEKMTQRARELGAVSSHFTNPHGLPDRNHYTTPHDLALIARAAMQQPVFRQFVGTQTHEWCSPEGNVELRNHNKMLRTFPGCTGLKTGYTLAAQHVLVSSALRNNREVISVVMHSDKPGKWTDSKQLLTYGLSHLPDGPRFD